MNRARGVLRPRIALHRRQERQPPHRNRGAACGFRRGAEQARKYEFQEGEHLHSEVNSSFERLNDIGGGSRQSRLSRVGSGNIINSGWNLL